MYDEQFSTKGITPPKHVDIFYFLAFGDFNGDWLRKKKYAVICSVCHLKTS